MRIVREEHVECLVLQSYPAIPTWIVGDLERDQPGDERPHHVRGELPVYAGRFEVGTRADYNMRRSSEMETDCLAQCSTLSKELQRW
jgi:hypothetical protein